MNIYLLDVVNEGVVIRDALRPEFKMDTEIRLLEGGSIE